MFSFALQDDHPIPTRHRTRVAFIVLHLRTALTCYLLSDVARLYARANPVFSTSASVASQGYVLRCLKYHCVVGPNLRILPMRLLLGSCSRSGNKSFRAIDMATIVWILEGCLYNPEILGVRQC